MTIDQARQAGGVTAVLERPGARLIYQVAGDGPAVVLIHGFGLDMRMWDPQVGPLADRFRVVRVRGLAQLDAVLDGVPWDPESAINDLLISFVQEASWTR